MKMCKNHFDIIPHPVVRCYQCAFKGCPTGQCLQLRIFGGIKSSVSCGGITKDTISDIFKL